MQTDAADPEELFNQAVSERDEGKLPSALQITLQLLSQVPESPRGRLLLANLYFLSGCAELASEEVSRLAEKYPNRESLRRLLKSLDPSFEVSTDSMGEEASAAEPGETTTEDDSTGETQAAAPVASEKKSSKKPKEGPKKVAKEEEVIAETDFEFDDLDLLGDDD